MEKDVEKDVEGWTTVKSRDDSKRFRIFLLQSFESIEDDKLGFFYKFCHFGVIIFTRKVKRSFAILGYKAWIGP